MVKHTQTIRRQLTDELFDHFVGLAASRVRVYNDVANSILENIFSIISDWHICLTCHICYFTEKNYRLRQIVNFRKHVADWSLNKYLNEKVLKPKATRLK